MMEPQNLFLEVIQAFAEFLERSLWERFTNFDCFGVEIAGKGPPMVACVMGAAGEEYGLILLGGKKAAEDMRAMQYRSRGDDTLDKVDLLSLSLEPFRNLNLKWKTIYQQAGIRPNPKEDVPVFLVKKPGRKSREPDHSELLLSLRVLKAVVAADRQNMLEPATLDDRYGICVLTLPIDANDPSFSVCRKQLESIPSRDKPLILSSKDLAGLPLLDETWLVGTPSQFLKIEAGNAMLFLIVQKESRIILVNQSLRAGETHKVVSLLLDTFKGNRSDNGKKGIPKTIIISNQGLYDSVSSALKNLGVKCIYESAIPEIQEVINELHDQNREKTDSQKHQVPSPDDLAGWKEADLRLGNRFTDFLINGPLLKSSMVIMRYFDAPDLQYFLNEHQQRGVIPSYTSWGVLDYRPSPNDRTHAEKMLEMGLPPAESMLLRARLKAHPSIYRVDGHDPVKKTIDLEDILLGGTVQVIDRALSECIVDGTFFPTRVYEIGNFHFIDIIGPPLGAGMGMDAAEYLRKRGMKFTREGLIKDAHKFGWLWKWIDEWKENWKPPRLCNTDGDELLLHTASFSMTDPEAVLRALRKRKDLEYDEHDDYFIWSRKRVKDIKTLGGPLTLGKIEIIGSELVLSVNSAKRLQKARGWLEKVPGVTFKNVTTRKMDEKELPLDDRLAAKEPPPEVPKEVVHQFQEHLNKQCMEWLDLPVPALKGKTPRQACMTPEGRQQVTMMIRTWSNPASNIAVKIPREAMLKELGIETEPSKDLPTQPLFDDDLQLPDHPKVGRNDPCPCGSGKKYKKCCGK